MLKPDHGGGGAGQGLITNANQNNLALFCGYSMSLNAFDQRCDVIAVDLKAFYSKYKEMHDPFRALMLGNSQGSLQGPLQSFFLFSLLLRSLTRFQVLFTRHVAVMFLTVSCFLSIIHPLSLSIQIYNPETNSPSRYLPSLTSNIQFITKSVSGHGCFINSYSLLPV